jgi:hypothetical protein
MNYCRSFSTKSANSGHPPRTLWCDASVRSFCRTVRVPACAPLVVHCGRSPFNENFGLASTPVIPGWRLFCVSRPSRVLARRGAWPGGAAAGAIGARRFETMLDPNVAGCAEEIGADVGQIRGGPNARGQWLVNSGNDGNAVRTRWRSLFGVIAFRWVQ